MAWVRHDDRELLVALIVSLSNYEGVPENQPQPRCHPRAGGDPGPRTPAAKPTLDSRLRGNDTVTMARPDPQHDCHHSGGREAIRTLCSLQCFPFAEAGQ